RTRYRARQSPVVAMGTLNFTASAPWPSQLSLKHRYGSSLRTSRLTPEARASGPVALHAAASTLLSTPTPSSRSMKMRLRLSSVSRSFTALGMRISMKFHHLLEGLFIGQIAHGAAHPRVIGV